MSRMMKWMTNSCLIVSIFAMEETSAQEVHLTVTMQLMEMIWKLMRRGSGYKAILLMEEWVVDKAKQSSMEMLTRTIASKKHNTQVPVRSMILSSSVRLVPKLVESKIWEGLEAQTKKVARVRLRVR